ncbi:hypothetical protein EC564_24675, partial [Vibrio parahaemolyticus]|nr:hypothetical protein [Vibrio parahaemolyticus]
MLAYYFSFSVMGWVIESKWKNGIRTHVDNGGRASRPHIDTQSTKEIELMARLRSALNRIF